MTKRELEKQNQELIRETIELSNEKYKLKKEVADLNKRLDAIGKANAEIIKRNTTVEQAIVNKFITKWGSIANKIDPYGWKAFLTKVYEGNK